MRKILFLSLCAVLLASCGGQSKKELTAENDSLRVVLNERDAVLDEMIGSITAIQDGFAAINESEGRISLESDNSSEKASATESIKEEMQFIAETIQKNKDEIAKLNKQLSDSRYNSSQLKKTVEKLSLQLTEKTQQLTELKAQLETKNIRIAELDSTVANLSSDVKSLTQAKESNEKEIAKQDEQLNTAWYVYGTKSELKKQKILDSGEVLQNSNYNKDYFTKIDIRETKSINLNSKSAKMLTTHPEGSYTLEKDSNKQYVLTITSPKTFWSISRYLVIQTR